MFGGFAKDVENIINREFRDGRGRPYVVSNTARPTFKEIVGLIRRKGGNAYDAAILFMITQVEALYDISANPEISNWAANVKHHCYGLSVRGVIASAILPPPADAASTAGQNPLEVALSASTLMATFLERTGVYETPLKLNKIPVIAYLYGWCDATVQLQKPSPGAGMAMMTAMFQDIYGRIRFASGQADESIGHAAYQRALTLLQGADRRYLEWFSIGGNELQEYLSQGTPPVGIMEALESMD